MIDYIKTLKDCIEDPSTLKEGFFIHGDGKINNHWIDLSGLHRQFLLNKKVVINVLRKKLIEEKKKNSIDTIIFTTQCFSDTNDFRLSCMDSMIKDALQVFNRKEKINYCYLSRTKTTYGGLILIPEPTKNNINALLITAVSSHEQLIKETLYRLNSYLPNSTTVLSIIGMKNCDENGKCDPIFPLFKDVSYEISTNCLIKFKSYKNKPPEEDHSVKIIDDYNITDRLISLFYDVKNIYFIVPFTSLICVFLYYNLPNINGFFEFLKQNLFLLSSLLLGVLAIIPAYFKYFHDIFKK